MCGITGFVDHKNNSSEDLLQRMTTCLVHRGPDDYGYFLLENNGAQVGLGHRRLSIIDLTAHGKQPFIYENYCIVFNGEIYNYAEIKKELQALGHTFKSNSDTEVILHAYAQWGKTCVHKFTGMFAFVLFDQTKQELFCARDRAGVKPFFYYLHNDLFLFSSELKTFHEHPSFIKTLDHDAISTFIQFGNVPGEHCIFKHCHKLAPASTLIYSLKDKTISLEKYWNVYDSYNKEKLNLSFEEAKTETEKVLKKAFDYRMVSDVPIGVFLSGGYDSACVTALLQKDRKEKIKTFTIAVPDIGLNEAPYAKDVARYLGTEHYEFSCTQKEAKEIIDLLPYYYDEPFADSSAIPSMLLCQLASKEVTVALSADAGDEVFAGYNRYDFLMRHGKRLNQMPSYLRQTAGSLMNKIPADKVPYLKNKYNFANRYEKLKSLLNDPSPENFMMSLSRQYNDLQLQELFQHQIQFPQTAYQSTELRKEYYSPLAYMMAVDYQTYLVDDILQKVDRASMSAGLEAREPFLDQNIIEWAARLPDEFKYNKGTKKYILREIVHQHIPEQMMNRPKMGFAIPIEAWLKEDLADKVNHYLNDERIIKQGIFQVNAIKKLKEQFFSGKKELAVKVWYLLMFQMWHEKWME